MGRKGKCICEKRVEKIVMILFDMTFKTVHFNYVVFSDETSGEKED